MRRNRFSKGIYCIEGLWEEDNLLDKCSVLPMLELLKRVENCDYIYHDCATREELQFYMKKFRLRRYLRKYPILYFACHGDTGCITLPRKHHVSIDEIGDVLEGSCHKSIIFFASCATLKIDKRRILRFLRRTGAIAAVGYKTDVEWVKATAFEMLLLKAFQNNSITIQGMNAVKNRVKTEFKQFAKELDFRMIINQ